MKNRLIFTIVLSLVTSFTNAQCFTRQYINIAEKVFSEQLTDSDFTGNLFITIDTANSIDLRVPSLYFECAEASELITIFKNTMSKIKVDGNFFNYYEHFNNTLYNAPLHQSYLINDSSYTYKIDIWNNPEDVTKIEGLTLIRLNQKLQKTPY